MQKRTSKRWPFRDHADPREDPWHPETTFGTHPERDRGAEDSAYTVWALSKWRDRPERVEPDYSRVIGHNLGLVPPGTNPLFTKQAPSAESA